ncbi:MAG: YqgE/AlgH family protein [Sedimenticolaceae bacterium]|jgi:putative transcriptional regulator
MEKLNLTNHLLIAMPSMEDPNFAKTVTLICEHNDEGAMGIVINRKTDIALNEVYEQMEIESSAEANKDQMVHIGGPVQEQRGFILHDGGHTYDSTMKITDDLFITTSRDILEDMAQGKGPTHSLIALGYAGWSPGQLEDEVLNNAWLTSPANNDILFEMPNDRRWEAAAKMVGVNIHQISGQAGHA